MIFRRKRAMTSGSELAAMEGRKFGLDQAMTGLSCCSSLWQFRFS